MTLIDLGNDHQARLADRRSGIVDPVPRAVLTLPELAYVADACDVRLPFNIQRGVPSRLEARLGGGPAADPDLETLFAAYPDPDDSLADRGLLDEAGRPVPLLECVLKIVAAPEIAVDLDLAVQTRRGPVRARSLHHLGADHLAVLATLDGAVYEAALMPAELWPLELARTATPPVAEARPADEAAQGVLRNGAPGRDAPVVDGAELALDLINAGVAAVHAGREDLLTGLLARHTPTLVLPGRTSSDATAARQLVRAMAAATGRLRAMVTRPSLPSPAPAASEGRDQPGDAATVPEITEAAGRAGVLSWVLLPDGWRWLEPVGDAAEPRVRIRRVTPGDLAAHLSPLIAQVLR